MFFNLVKKNSKKNRKENGLLFLSLIVTIVAFYIVLSLENLDVIVFLRTIESDAVSRLLALIPVLYMVSLFILFFLVYFAGKYQLERRSHELGMYLILGMRRRKLFFMLLVEEFWNSVISLLIGLPIGIFISEMISMITAKLVGLGIIGHKFSISMWAVVFTIVGYFIIRLLALLILSGTIAKKEIMQLIWESQDKKHRTPNKIFTIIKLILGVSLLVIAYGLAINGEAWASEKTMAITAILGIGGTFLLFHGMGILFEKIIKNKKNKNGLGIFTFRQLQENVFLKSSSLAVSSLLVLMAICCFGYGIAVSFNLSSKNQGLLHYTFQGNKEEMENELKKANLDKYMDEIFPVGIGRLEYREGGSVSIKNLIEAVERTKDIEGKDILLNNLQYVDYPRLISLTGYNNILKLAGKDSIKLEENQMALYNGMEFSYGNTAEILKSALKENVTIKVDNKEYKLIDELYQDNVVTDRSININYGLIVTDEVFQELVVEELDNYYWNGKLKDDFVKKNGLMQGIREVNEVLDRTGLNYESYLQNMGRELFYKVAASYTTIYLGVIFLIIANTVIGVQFLMQQKKNKKRYQTIINLGCQYKDLCKSARKQIRWYFSFPVVIAAIGSVFGVRGLFTGIASSAMEAQLNILMISAIPIIVILCIVEFAYIIAVMRMSDKEIYNMMEVKREDI